MSQAKSVALLSAVVVASGLLLPAGAHAATQGPQRDHPIVLADVNGAIGEISTTRLKTKDGKADPSKGKAIPGSGPKKDAPKTDAKQNR